MRGGIAAESEAPPLDSFPFGLSGPELRAAAGAHLKRAEGLLDLLRRQRGHPTIPGFLEPLDRLWLSVRNLESHGRLLFLVHPEPDTRAAGREVQEAADAWLDRMLSDPDLLTRVEGLELSRESPPTRFAVEKIVRAMRLAGAGLDAAGRARVLDLQSAIRRASNEFSTNIRGWTREIVLAGPEALDGLPEGFRREHPPGPDGRIRLSARASETNPVLEHGRSDEVRREVYRTIRNRGYPENESLLRQVRRLRAELAEALGFEGFDAYDLATRMLRSPSEVSGLLDALRPPLRDAAQAEYGALLARKRRDRPDAARLEEWDEVYYSRTPDGSGPPTAPETFRYGAVREALFGLCREMFGLDFRRVPGSEVWHPTVERYDVFRGERLIARGYLDSVGREGKQPGGFMAPVRLGIAGAQLPEAVLVMPIIPSGTPPEKAEIGHSRVVGFFHEFGHLVHHLLGGRAEWVVNTHEGLEMDFVEVPSVLFEEWAWDPVVLERIRRGAGAGPAPPLPTAPPRDALRALRWLSGLALASAALRIYSRTEREREAGEILRETLSNVYVRPPEPDSHIECGWPQIVSYGACYYTYVWSAMLARDLLTPFRAAGSLRDPQVAARYAREILEAGAQRPALECVRAFLGRDPSPEAFNAWVSSGR